MDGAGFERAEEEQTMNPKLFSAVMDLVGHPLPLPGEQQRLLNTDISLLDKIGNHTTKLTSDELDVVFQAFEYVTPFGLGRKPCSTEVRTKLQAIATRLGIS